MADILKMIRSNDIIKILLVLLAIYLIITYVNKNNETMENTEVKQEKVEQIVQPDLRLAANLAPVVSDSAQQKQIEKVVAGSDKLSADDLLPKYDDANAFAKENPVSKLLKEQNFLISGYHVGINTVMQSNKIPYQDIRSLPPIPKENVGPWNQSSYEQSPAQMRRFLEIGN
jgi:hypothetical protein